MFMNADKDITLKQELLKKWWDIHPRKKVFIYTLHFPKVVKDQSFISTLFFYVQF